MPDNLIELVDIWKAYGSTQVLKGLCLNVREGDFIVVRGRSGAGKTTLLKIVGLLEPPDRGIVRLFNQNVNDLSDDEKSSVRLYKVGFIFQFFNLIPKLTVLENIELPLAIAGVDRRQRRERVYQLLKYFGLLDLAERFPETLSGGERQRVAIIRAIVNNPKIILADEPTSSIDNENSELLISLLSRINKERIVTIILTTTDLYEKLPATREYLLKDGVLKQK
ncbi:MAG: ABC transporter ATP-binding protein [Nitrososphaeria archaeon]|nr:ABC transporter ATP-binding protein [Nitrososphaeria archaeon]